MKARPNLYQKPRVDNLFVYASKPVTADSIYKMLPMTLSDLSNATPSMQPPGGITGRLTPPHMWNINIEKIGKQTILIYNTKKNVRDNLYHIRSFR